MIRSPLSPQLHSLTAFIVCLMITGCASVAPENRVAVPEGIDGTKAQFAVAQGDNAYQRGDYDRALLEYINALGFDKDNVDALYKVGLIQDARGNYAQAEKALRRAVKLDKQHTGAMEALGLLLVRSKDYVEARQYLETTLRLQADRWKSHNGLGIIADGEQDHQRAEKHYQTALALKPDSPMLLTNLGYSKFMAGNPDQAESLYKKALIADPGYQKAWSNLGLLYTRQEQYTAAIKAFENYMDHANALNMVGHLRMADGDYFTAQDFFREAIRVSPSYFPEAYKNLEEAKRRAGGLN